MEVVVLLPGAQLYDDEVVEGEDDSGGSDDQQAVVKHGHVVLWRPRRRRWWWGEMGLHMIQFSSFCGGGGKMEKSEF